MLDGLVDTPRLILASITSAGNEGHRPVPNQFPCDNFSTFFRISTQQGNIGHPPPEMPRHPDRNSRRAALYRCCLAVNLHSFSLQLLHQLLSDGLKNQPMT